MVPTSLPSMGSSPRRKSAGLLQQPGLCGQLGKLCCVRPRLSSWYRGVMAAFWVPLIKQVPGPPGCTPAFHLETSEEKMGGTRANATLSFLGCQQHGAKLTRFLGFAHVLPRNRYILPLGSWRIDIHATLFPELLPWGGKGAGSRCWELTEGGTRRMPPPHTSPRALPPAPISPLGAQTPRRLRARGPGWVPGRGGGAP